MSSIQNITLCRIKYSIRLCIYKSIKYTSLHVEQFQSLKRIVPYIQIPDTFPKQGMKVVDKTELRPPHNKTHLNLQTQNDVVKGACVEGTVCPELCSKYCKTCPNIFGQVSPSSSFLEWVLSPELRGTKAQGISQMEKTTTCLHHMGCSCYCQVCNSSFTFSIG